MVLEYVASNVQDRLCEPLKLNLQNSCDIPILQIVLILTDYLQQTGTNLRCKQYEKRNQSRNEVILQNKSLIKL